jgi:hypothetical protein
VSRFAGEGKLGGLAAAPHRDRTEPRVEQLITSVRARLAASIAAEEARLHGIALEAAALRQRVARALDTLRRLEAGEP